jgi:hypothetical protein
MRGHAALDAPVERIRRHLVGLRCRVPMQGLIRRHAGFGEELNCDDVIALHAEHRDRLAPAVHSIRSEGIETA